MKQEFDVKVLEFKRGLVEELLDQCTKDQKEFFNRLYGGIDKLKEDSMSTAYDQCKRTLEKNKCPE